MKTNGLIQNILYILLQYVSGKIEEYILNIVFTSASSLALHGFIDMNLKTFDLYKYIYLMQMVDSPMNSLGWLPFQSP